MFQVFVEPTQHEKFTVICLLPPLFVYELRTPVVRGRREKDARYMWQKSQRSLLPHLSRALPKIPQKTAIQRLTLHRASRT